MDVDSYVDVAKRSASAVKKQAPRCRQTHLLPAQSQHGGNHRAAGGTLTHTDAAMSYYHAAIHPAAAYIAVTEYKTGTIAHGQRRAE